MLKKLNNINNDCYPINSYVVVWSRKHGGFIPGKVIKHLDENEMKIKLENGDIIIRHSNSVCSVPEKFKWDLSF